MSLVGIAVLAFVIAAVGTGLLRRYTLAKGIIDRPNERSSHAVPTPRGGGGAIVIAVLLCLTTLVVMRSIELQLLLALAGGGAAVAAVGFFDDRRGVQPVVRLVVHVIAAGWAVFWIGGMPSLQMGSSVVELGWVGHVLAVGGIALALNLFNFMDGIDGIAAAEATFLCFGLAALTMLSSCGAAVAPAAWIIGAASAGFLLWNWSPARIFMGDVGSGYLGYTAAVLPLAVGHEAPHALFVWLILAGVFAADSSVTLLRRTIRGERVHQAHRTHAYQHLARRWSHRAVTSGAAVINVLWLLPLATAAQWYPELSAWLALLALTPLVIAAIAVGAGVPRVHRDV